MPKKPNLLTVGQYKFKIKDIKEMSRQAIWQAAKKGSLHLLPFVKKIHRIGTYYLLDVEG